MSTLISHFRNEEYLLPYFCSHYQNLVDDAILINYHSTDNSVEIIKDICPHWKIITSKDDCFDENGLEQQVEEIERSIRLKRLSGTLTTFKAKRG